MPIDVERLRRHLDTGSDLTAVLKTHLWVESMLIGLIEVSLPNPDALDLDRMTFAQKLRLAEAAGGLQPEAVPWIRALNKLRNGLAHQLDEEASAEALEELLQFADKRLVGALEGNPTLTAGTPQERFRIWVAVYLLALEWHRMRLEWRKLHGEAIRRYEVQVALLQMAGTEVTAQKREELRQNWGFPPEPHYREVFVNGDGSSLFAPL